MAYNLQHTIPALERSLALFRPHHRELRQRLIKAMLTIVGCTLIAYIFAEKIAALFIAPLFAASPLVYKLVLSDLDFYCPRP